MIYRKISPFWKAAVLLAIIVTGALFTWWTVIRADRELREDLLQQTHQLARTVDVDRIINLSDGAAHLTKPDYVQLKKQLATACSINPQCRFVNLLGRRADGALFFFMDSEAAGSNDYSPPGQIYSEAPEDYHRVFVTHDATTVGPHTDHRGTWVSGLVPIHSPQTALHDPSTPKEAQAMVRKALDFYRKNGRDRLLQEINNPQGNFARTTSTRLPMTAT